MAVLSSLTKLSGDPNDNSSQGSTSGTTTLDLRRLDILKYVNLDRIPEDTRHMKKGKKAGVRAVYLGKTLRLC